MQGIETSAAANQTDEGVSAGYAVSRFNATQHGILAKATVLAWEDRSEFDALHAALIEEHDPQGVTEAHLVEEIAGIIWRKRRARLAEGALHNRALQHASEYPQKTINSALLTAGQKPGKLELKDAIRSRPEELSGELAELEADEAATMQAVAGLQAAKLDYAAALGSVFESTRDAWANQLSWEPDDYLDGAEPYRPDAVSLLRYLQTEIVPWYARERAHLEALPLVRAQALAESLDPDKLERLTRYEVHLDRKFERTLSTLLRLQDVRRARGAAG